VNFAPLNKRKIINDPVHGFITVPGDLIFDIIECSEFQRLRRILQLGLTHLVYPGALHTRFQHALGAMHLMMQAVEVLRLKGNDISDEEAEGLYQAILLHDIGHGPFSHALEFSIVKNVNHEELSGLLIERLDSKFNGKLGLAKEIFNNSYKKKFLHQLISGQLDVDRLDYLKRDSFFTGVSEGVISTDRIIKMLNVSNDALAVEEKGIYSIEKFIVARRLMYWQVYYHKAVISAEQILIKILERAKYLVQSGFNLIVPDSLRPFLVNDFGKDDFMNDNNLLDKFTLLDDYDIVYAIKQWVLSKDFILSLLCRCILDRQLFKVELSDQPFPEEYMLLLKKNVIELNNLNEDDADYLLLNGSIANNAYNPGRDKILIVDKSGEIKDISKSADQLNVSVLAKTIKKYFICYPKNCKVL
jgi:HD superfamily phosphohydrolase